MSEPNLSAQPREIREKLAKVDLGLQAQAFLSTPVGKYLVDRAEGEVAAGVERLKTMDIVKDPLTALQVQSDIKRAESFMYWMAEVITEGAETMNEVISQERAEQGLQAGAAEG